MCNNKSTSILKICRDSSTDVHRWGITFNFHSSYIFRLVQRLPSSLSDSLPSDWLAAIWNALLWWICLESTQLNKSYMKRSSCFMRFNAEMLHIMSYVLLFWDLIMIVLWLSCCFWWTDTEGWCIDDIIPFSSIYSMIIFWPLPCFRYFWTYTPSCGK